MVEAKTSMDEMKINENTTTAKELTFGDDVENDSIIVDNNSANEDQETNTSLGYRLKDIFVNFAPLGLIAFGGPAAHVALLSERAVESKHWVDEKLFTELFGIGSLLPGPTSTQLVISLATYRSHSVLGGLLAFMLWNIPSFIILMTAGILSNEYSSDADPDAIPDWMAGLAPAATSLVFLAAYKLGGKVIDSKFKILLCLIASLLTVLLFGDDRIDPRWASLSFPAMLLVAGGCTLLDANISPERRNLYIKQKANRMEDDEIEKKLNKVYISKLGGGIIIFIWLGILITMIVLRSATDILGDLGLLFETMYRIGSIIYGGGQVVLPMLLTEVVAPGWITRAQFFQGFALVQALPGPLFNFSAFVGAAAYGISGGFVAWVGLFFPGVSLVLACIPFYVSLRRTEWFKIFLQGVTAAAIGLVVAACVQLWEVAVTNSAEASVALFTGCLVGFFKIPAPIAIILGGVLGFLFTPTVLNFAQTPYCPVNGTSAEY